MHCVGLVFDAFVLHMCLWGFVWGMHFSLLTAVAAVCNHMCGLQAYIMSTSNDCFGSSGDERCIVMRDAF